MTTYEYKGPWPWPNFAPAEIACKCCGDLWSRELGESMPLYFAASLDALQELRDAWGEPLVISSGHRCPKHNRAVNGAEGSQHLRLAFDCLVASGRQQAFVDLATQAGFLGIGRYPARGFVHLDCGPKRRWVG